MNRRKVVPTGLVGLLLVLVARGAIAAGPQWIDGDEAAAFAKAKKDKTLVLVSVRADASEDCARLEADVLSRAEFAEAAKGFVLLRIDAAKKPEFLQRTGQEGVPTTAFLRPDGKLYYSVSGYYYWEAYVAMVETVDRFFREGTDPKGLPAEVEKVILEHPDPAAAAKREADQTRTRELLDAAGATYTQNERGMYSVSVDGVDVFANVGNGVMSFQKWWATDTEDLLALCTKLLRANRECAIGKFGLDPEGDVWLEQHAVAEGLTGPAVTEYLKRIAGLAKRYEQGEDLADPSSEPGDGADVKALLGKAGIEAKDEGGGVFTVTINGDSLVVVAGEGVAAVFAATEMPTLADDKARLGFLGALASSNYANYIGKFMLDKDSKLSVGWATLVEGTSPEAFRAYIEGTQQLLANYRAAVLAPAAEPADK
jgi:hypothetical protein